MNFLNQIIQAILEQVVGPVVAKLGKGWKTSAGIGLWLLVAVSRTLLEGRGFEPSTLDSIEKVLQYAEYLATGLFGVGVYSKVQNMDPKAVPTAEAAPKKK